MCWKSVVAQVPQRWPQVHKRESNDGVAHQRQAQDLCFASFLFIKLAVVDGRIRRCLVR
jgi:hypothetical protein